MSRQKELLVADLFCGCGGTSTGAQKAINAMGLNMKLVVANHWKIAIETHRRMHPEARHYCQDIATLRPHIAVPEGYLDLLLASPSCTHYSPARGGKPTSDQQRSDPWHIITWFTELRVKRAIIENVPAFRSWGPVDPRTQRPIKSRKGEYFRAWIATIHGLGGTFEDDILNCADFGDPTTRMRWFAMIRFDGKKIYWPVPTHMRRQEGKLELFPTLKPWRPAREIIDWGIKGKSIFNRKRPLSPNTLARIYAGAEKLHWPEPYLVILRNHMAGQSVDAPVPTVAANGNHIGLAEPILLSVQNTGKPRSVDDPISTITTGGAGSDRPGCARPMLVEPFMLSRQGGGAARPVDEPTPTQVAKHSHALIAPYYGSGSGETCKSIEQPLDTVTTKARFGMVVPVTHSQGGPLARDLGQPIPAVTTAKGGELAMVMPVTHNDPSNRARNPETDPLPGISGASRGDLAFITAQFGEREGQAPRVHDIDAPAPAICATGHVNLVEPSPEPVYDILFRMLEPHELAAAMGFSDMYEFAGTKTEQIKQIGNAVPVGTATALVTAALIDAAAKPAKVSAKKREAA